MTHENKAPMWQASEQGQESGGRLSLTGKQNSTDTSSSQSLISGFVKHALPDPAILAPATVPDEPAYLQDAPRPGARERKRETVRQPDNLVAPDLETALVGAALQDADVFALDFDAADLHDERLQAIWRRGQELVQAGRACDSVILGDVLETHGDKVPVTLLAHLLTLDVLPQNAADYAERVRDLAQRRRAFAELQAAVRVIHTSNGTWADDLTAVTTRLSKLAMPARPGRAARVTGWTAVELLAASFPEPQWAVPGLVPVGLSFLGGRPKVGKSWLALQLAIAKGTGGRVLDRQVEQGPALYLALEDNGRRLPNRATKQGMPSTAAIRFETSWPRLTDGGLTALEQAIDSEGYRLVIVDTLGRAFGRGDMDDYSDTTAVLGALQELAIGRDVAVITVDHHRKGAPGIEDDPVDAILGSTGKSGAADAILGLTKQQGKAGARLRVKGREVEELDLVLSWDAALCCWQYTGTAEEVELQGRRGLVLSILQDAYPETMLAADIAKDAMMHREKVIPLLNDLVREGHATKEPKQGREQPYRATRGNNGGA